MAPFTYPAGAHVRRHGPQGYADAESYRPWLRDEFTFRCVYCLVREQWGRVRRSFDLDHFVPLATHPEKALHYDNLVYCCSTCNCVKGKRFLPDPLVVLLERDVQVHADGTIEGHTPPARRLIARLGLNDREYVEFRLLWLGIIELAKEYSLDLYQRLMGFPFDLPNLARLRPPQGNTRPKGMAEAYFAQRRSGGLPGTY